MMSGIFDIKSGIFDEAAMTFRERFLATTVAIMAVVYGGYAIWYLASPHHFGELPLALTVVVIAQIALSLVVNRLFGIPGRPEKEDERDRLIHLRGASRAYHLTLGGIVMVFVVLFHIHDRATGIHALLAVLVIGQFVFYGSQLVDHRRM
jgi:uncharacterized membrane protein